MVIDPATVSGAASYRWLTSCVVPRPIALVSTISPDGVHNLAPFSFFNAVCGDPPMVCFAPSHRVPPKDTLSNVLANGEFVVNIVSEAVAAGMNACSETFAPDVDEFTISCLTPVPSTLIRPARVRECHVNLECRVRQIIPLSERPDGGSLVLGEVVLFHIDDAVINGSRIDMHRLDAIGRMGGPVYTRTRDMFTMPRPGPRRT